MITPYYVPDAMTRIRGFKLFLVLPRKLNFAKKKLQQWAGVWQRESFVIKFL